MEIKKTPKANLENRRLIFTEIGLVVALLLVLGAFSMGSKEKKIADLQEVEQQVEIEDMVPITQETPPPPPDQPKIPVILPGEPYRHHPCIRTFPIRKEM